MKPNRTNVFTQGVCDIIANDKDRRLCLFEIDSFNPNDIKRIEANYQEYGLDVLKHRTQMGFHYLSPSIVSRDTQKAFHGAIKDINPECPMTTLRIEPNKYPNEADIWFASAVAKNASNASRNSTEMCDLLNRIWGVDFRGSQKGSIKLVRYPLPVISNEVS